MIVPCARRSKMAGFLIIDRLALTKLCKSKIISFRSALKYTGITYCGVVGEMFDNLPRFTTVVGHVDCAITYII